jgi:hypothetical protein
VRNPGSATGTWHWVAVKLNGLNLSITPNGSEVTHARKSGWDCFYPVPAVSDLAAGATYAFTAKIMLGTAGNVSGVAIQAVAVDAPACA